MIYGFPLVEEHHQFRRFKIGFTNHPVQARKLELSKVLPLDQIADHFAISVVPLMSIEKAIHCSLHTKNQLFVDPVILVESTEVFYLTTDGFEILKTFEETLLPWQLIVEAINQFDWKEPEVHHLSSN